MIPLLFSGSSHRELSSDIATILGTRLSPVTLERFPDGEQHICLQEQVTNKPAVIIQTLARDPDRYLMELLLIADALKRHGAKEIIAIIPYFGYSRQDRINHKGEPISARLVAKLLEAAGVSRVITMDLHSGQIQGFFDIPLVNLTARPVFAEACKDLKISHPTVVAPDIGSVKTSRKLATLLGADFAVIDKERIDPHHVEMGLIGSIQGKSAIIADDICSTGTTLVRAAEVCRASGAIDIFGCITHPLFSGKAQQLVETSCLKACFVMDTVPLRAISQHDTPSKVILLPSAPLFASAVADQL